ncbi:hypothetical protein GCM10009827_007920 [Dactylosporangium maewongense]|uniref:Uncharacterized protein n=1 Tax=Dactylosporangium maewongense TaxID=634393 RepID=A0ABN1ZLM6_9ACTN
MVEADRPPRPAGVAVAVITHHSPARTTGPVPGLRRPPDTPGRRPTHTPINVTRVQLTSVCVGGAQGRFRPLPRHTPINVTRVQLTSVCVGGAQGRFRPLPRHALINVL